MRKATLAAVALATVTTLAPMQQAGADAPCADCLIEGVVAAAGWSDPFSFSFEGTIVGTMISASTNDTVGVVGTISGSVNGSEWAPGVFRGDGIVTISMSLLGEPRSATFAITMAGTGQQWALAGAKPQQAGYRNAITGDLQLAVPGPDLDSGTYVGAVSAAMVQSA